jgi:hypothetical protein
MVVGKAAAFGEQVAIATGRGLFGLFADIVDRDDQCLL